MRLLGKGKCSDFGGPFDKGVGPGEGLALVNESDLRTSFWRELFLPVQPQGTTGLARRLNPFALYCACRWKDFGITREQARNGLIKVTTLAGKSVIVRPVDFGPGDGTVVDGQQTQDTGRIIDLSTGALLILCAHTDNIVTVEWLEAADFEEGTVA